MRDAATDPWLDGFQSELLAGARIETVVAKAVEAGISPQVAARIAEEVTTNPLFAVARELSIRLESRDWWLAACASVAQLSGERGKIDVRSTVTHGQFRADYYCANRALFMPHVASSWPAIHRWTAEYLTGICGGEVIEVMMNRTDAPVEYQTAGDRLKQSMVFAEFIDLVHSCGKTNDVYMVSKNRFFERSGTQLLLGDLGHLECVNTNSAGENIKMWFGPSGTITPLHHDGLNNVIVQIRGSKIVRLYSPYDSKFMRQKQWWFAATDPGAGPIAVMPGEAEPVEIRLRLSPGDALFIPVGWWHAVEAEDVSITLAFVDFGVPNHYPVLR